MKPRHPRYWSLSVKLPVTLAAVVMAVAVTIGLALLVQERQRIRSELEGKALLAASSVASNAAEPMMRSDYWALFKILEQTAAVSDRGATRLIVSGMVLDRDGRVMAHLDPEKNPIGLFFGGSEPDRGARVMDLLRARRPAVLWTRGEEFVEGAYPIMANDGLLGMAVLRLSTSEIRSRTLAATLTIFGIAVTLAAVGSAIGAFISGRMVRPLHWLAEAMGTVAKGEPMPAPRVRGHHHDEIGLLLKAFDAMARDLEEKRRLEKELATGEKLVALGRIAAGVAHEINNPLAGLLNSIDTIEKFPHDRSLFDRYLPLIKNGLHRIQSIVRSLLVELRVEGESGRATGECLDDVRDLIRAEIQDRPIRLTWSNALACDALLQCRRVQQAVMNLLKNAVDAVGDEGCIDFHAYADGEDVVIEIRDDGVGVPPENLSRLFDPFFTSKPAGTGLGLWMTYRLIQTMDGTIEVDSEPGRGSLFRIRIPRDIIEETGNDERIAAS